MKTFLLKFEESNSELDKKKIGYGTITIGDFIERFECDFSFWNKHDYKIQWREAIDRIKRGENISCFITSMRDPDTANFIVLWPIFREGDVMFFRNRLLFLDSIEGSLKAEDPYCHIAERETTTEGDLKASEWEIHINDLLTFHEQLNCELLSLAVARQ